VTNAFTAVNAVLWCCYARNGTRFAPLRSTRHDQSYALSHSPDTALEIQIALNYNHKLLQNIPYFIIIFNIKVTINSSIINNI
jgi:hypothetical protein